MTFAFFDLDDTLVDTAGALRAWSLDFVAEHGLGDRHGGDEAGLRTVWLPRGRELGADDPRPEFIAATIGEAIAIIEASGGAE